MVHIFRLKNIALGYTLGNDIVGGLGMESVRFYVQGNNLVTFTNYQGLDPEINFVGGSDLSLGLDGGFYPIARSIQGGVRVTF